MMTDDQLILTITAVDQQDVKQEASFREWLTGKKQHTGIIYNELASGDRVLYFGSYHKDLDNGQSPWANSEGTDPAVIERLLSWTLEQPQSTQIVVFSFLDSEDKEAILPSILEELGLTSKDQCKSRLKTVSMASIMRKSLPASKEDLIRLIQNISPETKRPAATVRQWIRQETRKGNIYLEEGGDGNYYLA